MMTRFNQRNIHRIEAGIGHAEQIKGHGQDPEPRKPAPRSRDCIPAENPKAEIQGLRGMPGRRVLLLRAMTTAESPPRPPRSPPGHGNLNTAKTAAYRQRKKVRELEAMEQTPEITERLRRARIAMTAAEARQRRLQPDPLKPITV